MNEMPKHNGHMLERKMYISAALVTKTSRAHFEGKYYRGHGSGIDSQSTPLPIYFLLRVVFHEVLCNIELGMMLEVENVGNVFLLVCMAFPAL